MFQISQLFDQEDQLTEMINRRLRDYFRVQSIKL